MLPDPPYRQKSHIVLQNRANPLEFTNFYAIIKLQADKEADMGFKLDLIINHDFTTFINASIVAELTVLKLS